MRSKILYELRVRNVNPVMPGYTMLVLAIEATVKKGKSLTEVEILECLKRSRIVIPKVRIETSRCPEMQWMMEAIRNVGYRKSVISFVNEIADIVTKEITNDVTRGVLRITNLVNLARIASI